MRLEKKTKIIILFSSLLVVYVFFYLSLFKEKKIEPKVMIDKKLPNLISTSLLNDENLSLRNLNLDETFIVNIFASWCAPCKTEHPYLIRLKNKNYKIIGINYKDSKANAKSFLKKYQNPYYKVFVDRNGELSINLGARGVPETYLIDSNFVIISRHIGPINDKFYNLALQKK